MAGLYYAKTYAELNALFAALRGKSRSPKCFLPVHMPCSAFKITTCLHIWRIKLEIVPFLYFRSKLSQTASRYIFHPPQATEMAFQFGTYVHMSCRGQNKSFCHDAILRRTQHI